MALGTVWGVGTWDVNTWDAATWDDATAGVYGDQDPQQMVVYPLSDITGLRRWVDYIPVEYVTWVEGKQNTHDDDGFRWIFVLGSTAGLTAWVHYTPVYVLDGPDEDEGRYDDTGWIPVAEAP
jgi:hypothetical protein